MATDSTLPTKNNATTFTDNTETNLSKINIPLFYKDYKWDIGVVGGLTMDGAQAQNYYFNMGAGLHLGYHLTEYVSLHGEVMEFFKSVTKDESLKDDTNRLYALSAAFDFSADRTYSLYAKGGLGYEQRYLQSNNVYNAVSLLGFGFRYMLTDSISATVEGRWKKVLDTGGPTDNSLLGTIGLDYHFGLSKEKSILLRETKKHNDYVDEQLQVQEEAKMKKATLESANASDKAN